MATTTADAGRQVKIKTGSVRRLTKELDAYSVEAAAEEAKVAAMRAGGAEAHDLKHAENVLAEVALMVPDTRTRLEAALADLETVLDATPTDAVDAGDLAAAQEVAAAAKAKLSAAA